MKKFTLLILSAFLCFSTSTTFAQEVKQASETAIADSTITRKAEALSVVNVEYPPELRIFGQEGWVQVGFIVDKNGVIKDPIIEGSVGGKVFEDTALAALKYLKYKPAMYKGKPVEESVSGVFIPFLLDQTFEGVDTGFAEKFNQVLNLYNANDLTSADAQLAELAKSQDLTLTEVGMLEVARGYSAAQNNKPYEQLEHFRNASVNSGAYLPQEMLQRVMPARIALTSRMSLFDEAKKSFELFENADPTNQQLTPLAMMIAPIQNAIDLGQLVQVKGKISKHGYWSYQPLRRNFSFLSAEAGVKEIEPRCEIRNQRFTVNTTNEWRIPKSWGKCTIVIYGEPGANFALNEHADLIK